MGGLIFSTLFKRIAQNMKHKIKWENKFQIQSVVSLFSFKSAKSRHRKYFDVCVH